MDSYRKVLPILERLSLDAVLISDGYNMRYLSGFSGATGYLYISKNQQVILTDFRYTIQAEAESSGFQVIEINQEYQAAINRLLQEDGAKALGFEGKNMLYHTYKLFEKSLSVEKLTAIGDEITNLRSVKEDWELERIKKAQSIGDIAFSEIIKEIRPGMTELSVAAKLEYLMKENGAERLSFETIVASGVNSSMPHAVPTDKKIETGDFVTMDFGCVYKGYCSDMTRTIVVGKASEKQKKVYQTVLAAQLAALDFIKAGYEGWEIDKAARDLIYEAGYEGCFGHGLGHSVGLFIHENPRLSPKEKAMIHANMTETVEPGIYIKDFGGVRIEDLVAVTEKGHINFTKSEKQLIEL